MSDTTSQQYKVYLTPKTGEFTYGTEIQISAEILFNGIKTMKKSIDSGDYDIGVYTYGDIELKLINRNGKYNDELDNRSIFTYTRDLAKIRIVYSDNDGDITRFKGLINEEATKQNLEKEEIKFRVLSNDSVIRTTKVAGGLIANAILASTAIKSIINQSKIISVLNYSESNINVDQDLTIDDGSHFDDKNARKALNELLMATNSVLIIDSSDNMIVQSRSQNAESLLNLYGPYDERMRQNIHAIKKYNAGRHRTLTSIKVGGTEVNASGHVLDYGYRQKSIDLSFITNENTKIDVATKILNEFKTPFIELELSLPVNVAKNVDLLDPVSLNYPLRLKRVAGKFLPIVGVTKIDEIEMPVPDAYGDASISPNMAFKVIEISENPKSFETMLKLRQYGWFTDSASCYVGFAAVGEASICGTGDACDKFEVSFVGGGQVNCSKIG